MGAFDTSKVDPELDRVRSAYHEAGHAVAAWKLDVPIARIISTGAESHAEWAAVAIQPGLAASTMHRAVAVVLLAGQCAQMFWDPSCFAYGCNQDRADARYHAECCGEDFRRLEQTASYLVDIEWPRIRSLALALLKCDAMTTVDACRIIEAPGTRGD